MRAIIDWTSTCAWGPYILRGAGLSFPRMNLQGGADEDRIVEAAQRLLDRPPGSTEKTPYGDGCAAERIVEACIEWIGRSRS